MLNYRVQGSLVTVRKTMYQNSFKWHRRRLILNGTIETLQPQQAAALTVGQQPPFDLLVQV